MTPSNMSGALPMTTASMSAQSTRASASAARAASRTRPAIETSIRFDACLVWPTPITAQRSATVRAQHAHQVLLEARPRRGVRYRTARTPVHHTPSRLANPDQARHHHRVCGERPARRIDQRAPIKTQSFTEDQLLMTEGGVKLCDVD